MTSSVPGTIPVEHLWFGNKGSDLVSALENSIAQNSGWFFVKKNLICMKLKQTKLLSRAHCECWIVGYENTFVLEKKKSSYCCVYRKCLGTKTTETSSWVCRVVRHRDTGFESRLFTCLLWSPGKVIYPLSISFLADEWKQLFYLVLSCGFVRFEWGDKMFWSSALLGKQASVIVYWGPFVCSLFVFCRGHWPRFY